jgi:hypothetical protein
MALLLGVVAGCAVVEPVVNSGSSRPYAWGEEPDPFRRLRDRTDVVAFEVGLCATDSDCVSDACGGATCAPADETPLCASSPVGACLSAIDPEACRCIDGACRWERSVEVLTCARAGEENATTRAKTGMGPAPYPTRPR